MKPEIFIVAEAGINHNGDLNLAMQLVDAAIEAGADAVKFQTFWDKSPKLKKYELSKQDTITLIEYCFRKGIMFFSTPHTLDAIDFLDHFVTIWKLASPFIVDEEFVKKIAATKKPVLLSTGSIKNKDGMATMKEIKQALDWLPDSNVTLLHCVSKYPCKDPHYERIEELKAFGKRVGLSDHSKNIKVPIVPVIERHFMLKGQECIDAPVSLDQYQFKEMVDYLRGGESC